MSIQDLGFSLPIIQGGMAIRCSMAGLAAAVANEGGLGVIAGSAIPIDELKNEIRKARNLITNKDGALGVNIMFAVTSFAETVKACIEEKVDVIICGAGFSRDVFSMVKDTGVKLFPIVSSLKLAKISEKLGADAIIVEGGNAGGHLGTSLDSWDIMEDITKNIKLPIFGAGGVMTYEDGKRMINLGCSGLQMGSRFVATHECEVDEGFKKMYVEAQAGDVITIESSAGLPANAIISKFSKEVLNHSTSSPKTCTNCLKHCTRTFCVKDSLIKGHDGDKENGLFFAGKEIHRIKSIISVSDVFKEFKPLFK